MIFAPGLPLVHGAHLTAELAAWAAARIPQMEGGDFGPCWAVGVVRGGALAAVVVYHDWQSEHGTVQISVAASTPRWASRQVVGALLGAAFLGGLGRPVRKVMAVSASTNERVVRFNIGIGMKREAVLREHFSAKVHAVVCSMMDREWRRRYGKED